MSPAVDIRSLRINRGLSQAQAAREMEIDVDALARAERGAATPHPRNAFKIAGFYGFKVTEVWPLEQEPAA